MVGLLLYRKHVITEQPYIGQLVRLLEAEGVIPLPIFINGVEAHTVVRDMLTTDAEQALVASGAGAAAGVSPTLRRDAVRVDAVVSTIGFPLVGGPAGTMEGGRQADIARAILSAKDVPYVVAAPLLIQVWGVAGWVRGGVLAVACQLRLSWDMHAAACWVGFATLALLSAVHDLTWQARAPPLPCAQRMMLHGQQRANTALARADDTWLTLFVPQDMASWQRDGVAGLQSVVLYSLPELDGAVDTVPLGGLAGNNIFLVPERVRKVRAVQAHDCI